MNLTLPINFGVRACDRVLVLRMSEHGADRYQILWLAFLVWRDFGTAREDRREVPLDPADRAKSIPVSILEEYIGWAGQRGVFIEECIAAGFFSLVPVTATTAELILTDFFPANAAASTLTNSEKGGVARKYNNIMVRAEASAADQLRLFDAEGGVQIEGAAAKDIKAATKLVHSICLSLNRKVPEAQAWKENILSKAIAVIQSTTDRERECILKWLFKNRNDQKIPLRLDFVLDQFASYREESVRAFGK
jgi:hypothetical protein